MNSSARFPKLFLELCIAFALTISHNRVVGADAGRPTAADAAAANTNRPFGISKRVPWTTSRIIGTPEPPSPYLVERAFPKLQFTEPVDIGFAPGIDRVFVMDGRRKIYSFANRQDAEKLDLFFDITNAVPAAQNAYGMVFHPGFQTNHYVFVCYVLKDGLADGSRVSRFKVIDTDPPRVDPASETRMITWLSGGHNGGCLKFGPDGYLYISTGDGAGPNPPDPLKTGQDNSDLLSSVLRIDVDHTDGLRNYRVPSDNPFIRTPGNRPEIWAYGFRNPWKISFDRKTGELWAGDVGWELWEMVYRIERGGNYGWSVVEGPQSIHPDWKRGPTPILPPVKAHPHSEAASITGGYVYRGTRFTELVGAYIYGDWVSGKIWALRSEGNKLISLQELVDTPYQIVSFAEDRAGELYVLDYAGKIHVLIPNRARNSPSQFPHKLSETGLFSSIQEHRPAPGVIPFLINAEMWADHALAERFVALPGTSTIQTGATNVWLYQSKNEWRYPTNAVLAKTFFFDRGRRRVETQVLHYDGLDWHAYSYRWNDDQTDADLVPPDGDEQILDIRDSSAPGGRRKQSWRFHSRTECLRCHNPWVNFPLAFTAPQLNREVFYQSNHPISNSQPIEMKDSPSRRTEQPAEQAASWITDATAPHNQLATFSHLGFFDQPLDERARPKFTGPYSQAEGVDLTERARSWLHVNCAHCHREGAGGSVVSHFDYDTKLANMKAIGRPPAQGTLGIQSAHVISPGNACSSVLYYRILTTGQGRMPLIGSRSVDVKGANLIYDWIQQLSKDLAEEKISGGEADKLSAENMETARSLWSSAALSRSPAERLDQLLSSTSGALALVTLFNKSPSLKSRPPVSFWQDKVENHSSFQVRDLFERFLPDDKRPKKLGATFDVAAVLSLKGDATNGKRIFFTEGGSQCAQCHRINGEGRDFGPDLSQIGKKYDRAQLLDHIVNPSKLIEPAFISYIAETSDDQSFTGLLVRRSAEEVILKDANAQEIRIKGSRIKNLKPQPLSAMPEALLQNMTAQGAADLIEFLSALR